MNHPPPSEALPPLMRPCFQLCLEHLQTTHIAAPQRSPLTKWDNVLEVWRAQAHWRSTPYSPRDCENAGVKQISASCNPFGAPWAEADRLLVDTRYSSPLYNQLTANPCALVYGATGSGKTASALTLAHDALYRSQANSQLSVGVFPVYCVWHAQLHLTAITALAAQTLLSYVLARPDAFLRHTIEAQSQLLELFWACLGPDGLGRRLEQAGFPRDERGQQVLEDLTDCLHRAAHRESTPEARLAMLARALPVGFTRWMVLIDGHEDGDHNEDDAQRWLAEMAKPLLSTELWVKIFLPGSSAPAFAALPCFELTWETQELRELLHKRLKLAGEDTTRAWCDMEASRLGPDELLVDAARRNPARLVDYGNEFLCRLGHANSKLKKKNLKDLFG